MVTLLTSAFGRDEGHDDLPRPRQTSAQQGLTSTCGHCKQLMSNCEIIVKKFSDGSRISCWAGHHWTQPQMEAYQWHVNETEAEEHK